MPKKRKTAVPFGLGWILSLLIIPALIVLYIYFWDIVKDFVLSNIWTLYISILVLILAVIFGIITIRRVVKKISGA